MSRRIALLLVTTALGAAAGCAGRNSAGAEPPALLIVGLTTEQPLRQAFTTVDALRAHGVSAASSYPLVPDLTAGPRQVELAARRAGVTAVLAVRALGLSGDGRLRDRSPFPIGDMAHLQTFYAAARQMLAGAPAPDHEVLVVSAYDIGTQRLIWGGVTWTFDLADWQDRVHAVSEMVADNVSRAIQQRPGG